MKLNPQGAGSRETIRGSFTIWDLIAIMVVLVVFGGWFAFQHTGERGRIAQCTSNLKTLGEAIQSFANEHQNELPAANINMGELNSWDMMLTPYLNPKLATAKSVYEKNQLLPPAQIYFFCPSDPVKRTNPRSYAMGGRDMHYGWPPTSDDRTGVGLFWDAGTVSILHDNELAESATKNPDLLPRMKQSLLQDPANTLLLTELIGEDNSLRRGALTRVFEVNDQRKSFNGDVSHFHHGKFNYLMNDGHVELLTGQQTLGGDGQSGNIWTINAGD
jgi:prepilin-type processing-associated H-X9-DG protein